MHAGRTVLIVETEFIIGLGISSVLETRFAAHPVVCRSASEAFDRAAEWSSASLAVIELESNRPDLIELARSISQSGIRVLGLSADSRLASGVPGLPGTPILIKPVPDDTIEAAIRDIGG
ncbi:hypothetical protein [Devosia sediminis]|uniref:Response regulatory domain-containing protein n=1 Tax=Devosia sediminis TaxID=2798801 RepID=A0A934IW20_9HYPH|nr:hypothetical protein [Devosia sediminis]MBJ3783260.1 hypothetical protein [Devosia sediminis]